MLPIYYAVSFTLFYGFFSSFLLTWGNIRHLHGSKVKTLPKKVYSEKAPFHFLSFFSFLQKFANSYNVYTWIHPVLSLQMVHVMYSPLYLSFLHARDLREPNQWYNSNSKASRLETRKSCCFGLSLKAGKIQWSNPKAVWQEESHTLGGSMFFLYADLSVIRYS